MSLGRESTFDLWSSVPFGLPQEARDWLYQVFENAFARLDDIDLIGEGVVIPDEFLTTAMHQLESITAALMADSAIATRSLQDGAVTLAKILNGIFTADAAGRAKFAAGFIDASLLAAAAVETAALKDANVTRTKLAGGFAKKAFLSGNTPGDFTVTGIAAGDELTLVLRLGGTVADLTGEFTITGADTINNAGGTDTTGDSLLVLWTDLT